MTRLELIGGGLMIRGTLGGIRQPSFVFTVQLRDPLDGETERAGQIAKELLHSIGIATGIAASPTLEESQSFIDTFLECISIVLTANEHPVFQKARIMHRQEQTNGSCLLTVQQPCLDYNAAIGAVLLCTDYFSAALGLPDEFQQFKKSFPKAAKRHLANLRKGRLKGFNIYHFLKNAHDLDVPWFRISGDTFQLGHGCAARLLNSSFTDRSSWIGNTLSKNKNVTARVMLMAGLPVPEQVPVSSADHAVDAAEKIGFPVVVKPVHLDGGRGVTAFLTQPEDVAQAYREAAELSEHTVVEKHIKGKDYRLQVVDGDVQGIVEREPGGVVGDGVSSVSVLIRQQNLDRKTAQDDRRFLHPIEEDGECRRMLKLQNLTLDAVPAAGRFVPVRGAANVASGGIPRVLETTAAHPDNLELAARAARVMRLDVAGVDLITKDIGVSWLETGAAICEVNAQPQMFTDFHQPMLRKILGSKLGRIPVCVILEDPKNCRLGHQVFGVLSQERPNAGFVSSTDVLIGNRRVTTASGDLVQDTGSLLVDPVLDSLVLSLPPECPNTDGWPIDRADVVILTSTEFQDSQDNTPRRIDALAREIGMSLRPHTAFLPDDIASVAREMNVFSECTIQPIRSEAPLDDPRSGTAFACSVTETLLGFHERQTE